MRFASMTSRLIDGVHDVEVRTQLNAQIFSSVTFVFRILSRSLLFDETKQHNLFNQTF